MWYSASLLIPCFRLMNRKLTEKLLDKCELNKIKNFTGCERQKYRCKSTVQYAGRVSTTTWTVGGSLPLFPP